MSIRLNRDQPYSTTFGDDAQKFPFFQGGLYFARDGSLLECQHNDDTLRDRSHAASIVASDEDFGLSGDTDKEVVIGDVHKDGAPPVNPAVLAQLNALTDKEVYEAALRARARLDDEGSEDAFNPDVDMRDANVAFIVRHLA